MNLLFLNIGVTEAIYILPLFAFMIYTLFHALTNRKLLGLHRLLWFLLVLCLPLLGAIAYWVMGRNAMGSVKKESW